MKYKTISSIVVPSLLILTGTFGYLTIENNWNYEIASYFIFLFTLFYILILERIIPLKQEWKQKKHTIWTDIKHFFFSAALFDALGKMFAVSLVLYIQEHLFSTSIIWKKIPFIITFIIANLIGEFLPYLYHRISHKGNTNSYLSHLLWETHSIHHLPTSLNWFKTNWIHPINMFLNVVFKILPLLMLGFSKEIIFLIGILHLVIAYISHANIQTKKSFWDYLVVTPQIHHFHHSNKIEEAKNFGNTLPFWDLFFGTYYNRIGPVNNVGIIEENNINYPDSNNYIKQLTYPITTFKSCCKK
jgi:sterol desaturase/sphingolipid hydroxylase (fatty acid hydroxylase superfamily)